MISDVEHLFMCLFAIGLFSIVKCLSVSIAHVLNRFFALLQLNFESSFYILDTSPLSDMRYANIFSYSTACLFMLLMEAFTEQKL